MIATYPEGPLEHARWIDLLDPTREELDRVHAAAKLHVPTKHEVSEIESTSRVRFQDGAYYMSSALATRSDEGEHDLAPIGFVLSDRVLLTIRFSEFAALDEARKAFAKAHEQTAHEAFIRILEIVVDCAADALEHAGNDCDALSRAVFRAQGRKTSQALRSAVRRVGMIASRAAQVSEALLGIDRIATFVTESEHDGAPEVDDRRLKAVRADIASLTDFESRLSANVQFTLDATLGFINIEQNEIVKTLTIASMVGVPPVLIAGIYGMNFKHMPELSWRFGYPMALALIVASAVVPLLWFKKRGWM